MAAVLLAVFPAVSVLASETTTPDTVSTQSSETTPASGTSPPAGDPSGLQAAGEDTPPKSPETAGQAGTDAGPDKLAAQETTPTTDSAKTGTAPDAGITASSTAQIVQHVDSTSTSGDAAVSANETAGDAKTGTATANATIVNVVGNSTGLGESVSPQIWNIYNPIGQDYVQGDITIDPSSLVPVAGSTSAALYGPAVPVRSSTSLTDIENNVTLNAVSGDATVNDNGQAGSAVSGDAAAMATIINLVSSNIGARNAFLGVVNIFGDLRGDILVPASFVDSLIASNAPGGSTTTQAAAPGAGEGTLSGTINISDTINLSALSGDATVSDNGQAGKATSGDATTRLTVFNLTGQEVIARNSLLVFVNVMGRWTGMIVPAPAGSTAAALGGGVGSTGQQGISGSHQQDVNIRNNVNVSARSGNAAVTGNGQAGSATSGSAYAGANILNLVHSSFSLDDWFGALFINVIGSWLGDFDIAPDAAAGAGPAAQGGQPLSASARDAIRAVRVFQFDGDTSFTPAPVQTVAATADIPPVTPVDSGTVLGDDVEYSTINVPQPLPDTNYTALLVLAGAAMATVIAGGAFRHHHRRS